MNINLHEPTFGEEEIQAAVDVLRSTNVTSGDKVREFESKFGPYSVMCNSGSSANLLAIAALCNPLTPDHLSPGDEVIVSALSWATTIWPLVQYGLVPVIVDIDPDTLNIDPREVEKAIGPRTKAIMPVHVYGNPCDMNYLNNIAKNIGLYIIEDCCEALSFNVGYSDFNTYSFYFSHHITTLEGGMVTCQHEEHADMLRTLRAHGWTREQKNRQHVEGIDDKFLFVNAGYNLRSTELNAAIGLVQFKKLEGFIEKRKQTANRLKTIFKKYDEYLAIQNDMGSTWFGFPVIARRFRTVGNNHYLNERTVSSQLREHLENDGIETRSIICGNIANQPGMKLWPHRIVGNLKNANHVMLDGFSIPCHQGMTEEDCDHIRYSLDRFYDREKILTDVI